ncbi:MAG TPA: hypothetical protein VHA56_20710 [Mucilaginibacter sp.]|nr:hypothetical protein [Mucilaginibacter sp.]
MQKSRRKYIVLGLLAILLIYTLYYMAFVYVSYFNEIPRKVRHIARLVSILLVYGIGYYTLKKYGVKWISAIWNYIYFVVVLLLILIGLYDWTLGPASQQIRNVAKTLHEFLISPVLYAGLLIINRMLTKIS